MGAIQLRWQRLIVVAADNTIVQDTNIALGRIVNVTADQVSVHHQAQRDLIAYSG
jgi:hypothetical protein